MGGYEMTAAQRRVFRIEKKFSKAENGVANGIAFPEAEETGAEERHREVMNLLHELKGQSQPQEQISSKILEDYKHDLLEAKKVKDELNSIYEAINRTKQEIVTLHDAGREDLDMTRMADELGAIVKGTEEATETILHSAEEIDTKATDLIAALKIQTNKDDACDIQEKVIKIFEACNFQDLTGQRITKVVKAFCFIEERVERMMEIWGGIESFKDVERVEVADRSEHEELLNGPALEADEDVASQDDIDALFN